MAKKVERIPIFRYNSCLEWIKLFVRRVSNKPVKILILIFNVKYA